MGSHTWSTRQSRAPAPPRTASLLSEASCLAPSGTGKLLALVVAFGSHTHFDAHGSAQLEVSVALSSNRDVFAHFFSHSLGTHLLRLPVGDTPQLLGRRRQKHVSSCFSSVPHSALRVQLCALHREPDQGCGLSPSWPRTYFITTSPPEEQVPPIVFPCEWGCKAST